MTFDPQGGLSGLRLSDSLPADERPRRRECSVEHRGLLDGADHDAVAVGGRHLRKRQGSGRTQRCTQYVVTLPGVALGVGHELYAHGLPRRRLDAALPDLRRPQRHGERRVQRYRLCDDFEQPARTRGAGRRERRARSTIDVSWTALAKLGADAVTGYGIEVSTDEGDTWETLEANTGGTATTYAHTGLSRGALRHYRVRAIAGTQMTSFGQSAWARTTPTAPGKPVLSLTQLPITRFFLQRFELSWPRPDDGGEGDVHLTYQFTWTGRAGVSTVYRNDQGHDAVELAVEPFAPGDGAFSFKVRALNPDGVRNCTGSDGNLIFGACVGAGPWSETPGTVTNAVKPIGESNAASLLGRFANVPAYHDGSSRFRLELHFSEAPEALNERDVAGGLLEVDGGRVMNARRLTPGSDLGWEVTVQPTRGDDITIVLPVRACDAEHAVCANDEPLAAAVSATVERAGAAVTGVPTVTAPGDEGVYARGERVEARVAFDASVTVDVSAGSPTLGLALGGVRREAAYASGSGTAELVFAYTAVEADEGAAQAKAIANGIVLNGATIQGEGDADAVLDFGEAPGVASLSIGDDAGGDGAWDPGETLKVVLVFEEPVEVDTSGGVPSIRVLVGTGEKTLAYVRGSETDRLVFSYRLVEADERVTSVRVPEGSPALNGGVIRSTAGLDASLAHNGASREGAPHAVLPVVSVADDEAAEGETLAFVVTLAPAASAPVTVDWATADGTATAGSDYTAATGTLAFAAGETEKTVEVATTADAEAEAAETLALTLSNASGATIGNGGATGTVTDPGPAAFTGSFANAPPEHDGSSAFTLEFHLSEQPRGLGWRTVKDHLFEVAGGSIERARRIGAGAQQGVGTHRRSLGQRKGVADAARDRSMRGRTRCVHVRRAHAPGRGRGQDPGPGGALGGGRERGRGSGSDARLRGDTRPQAPRGGDGGLRDVGRDGDGSRPGADGATERMHGGRDDIYLGAGMHDPALQVGGGGRLHSGVGDAHLRGGDDEPDRQGDGPGRQPRRRWRDDDVHAVEPARGAHRRRRGDGDDQQLGRDAAGLDRALRADGCGAGGRSGGGASGGAAGRGHGGEPCRPAAGRRGARGRCG